MTQKVGSLSCYYCTITAESWNPFVRPARLAFYLLLDPTWHWPWGSQLAGAPAATRGSLTLHHDAHMFGCQQSTNIDCCNRLYATNICLNISNKSKVRYLFRYVYMTLCSMKLMWIMHKNSFRTSPRTQSTPITKTNRLMLYRGNNRCLLWKSRETRQYAVRLNRHFL